MPFLIHLVRRKGSAFRIALFHRHPVLGQRPRLIRADDIDRPQRFHRRKLADNRIHLHHPRHAQSQDDGDNRRKPLRHSRYRQGNGRQQHIPHIPFLQHRHKKKKDTDKNCQCAQYLSKICQSFLERGHFLFRFADHPGNMANLGIHSRSDYDPLPSPIGYIRGHISHIPAIPDIRLIFRQIGRILIHRHRLACQGRFLDFQAHGPGKAQIRRNLPPRFQADDVSRHQVSRRNLHLPSAPFDDGMRACQLF